MTASPTILLVHHFALNRVTGVRALLSDLMWRIPAVRDGPAVVFESYEGHDDPDTFVRSLSARHDDVTDVVGVNVHIDFRLDYTIGLLDWCEAHGRRAHLYVHDYWPKHRDLLAALVARYRCRLLASTEVIRDTMRADGLDALLVQVGVPLDNVERGPLDRRDRGAPRVVGSGGRIVPRKRFEEVVSAFGLAGVAGDAYLHLRLVASCVYSGEQDERSRVGHQGGERASPTHPVDPDREDADREVGLPRLRCLRLRIVLRGVQHDADRGGIQRMPSPDVGHPGAHGDRPDAFRRPG